MNEQQELLKEAKEILENIYNHLENLKWTNYYYQVENFLKKTNSLICEKQAK